MGGYINGVNLGTNVAIVTGTIEVTNGNGNKAFAYPSGFTQDNCVIVSLMIKPAGIPIWYQAANNQSIVLTGSNAQGQLNSGEVRVYLYNGSTFTGKSVDFKITLLRVA